MPKISLTALVESDIIIRDVATNPKKQKRISIQMLLKTATGRKGSKGNIKQCNKQSVALDMPNKSYNFMILYFIFNTFVNAIMLQIYIYFY